MNNSRFGVIQEVDERQLQLLMKDWRQGRATRTIWQALGDAYFVVFSTLLIGAMLISAIVKTQRTIAICSSTACLAGRGLMPWAALSGALAFTLAASLMFGPVTASSAEGFWLMDAPINRRRFLKRRLWLAIGAAFVLGASFGAIVAALTGYSGWAIMGWTLGTGLGSAGLLAVAAVEQTAERRWILRTLQWITGLGCLAALVLMVGTSSGWWMLPSLVDFGIELAWLVAGIGMAVMIGAAIIAYRRLKLIRRQRLMSGGALLAGMQGAMFALDFGLVRDILIEHDSLLRGHVKATRGAGQGLQALVLRDLQRLWRYPRPLLLLIGSIFVPYAVEGLGLGIISPAISALMLMVALIPVMNSLRVLSRAKGLLRCFPFSDAAVRTAAMTVPAVLALIWGLAACPAFLGIGSGTGSHSLGTAVFLGVLTAVTGLLAAVRWVSSAPANYSVPMVSTEVGAMPMGLAFNIIRGFDVVILITLPLMFGLPAWISVVIAIIIFLVLRVGGINMQRLNAENAERKRQLEQVKTQTRDPGHKEKIKIQRPR